MNNPGTRLSLLIIQKLLTDNLTPDSLVSQPDFLGDNGSPLFSASTLSRTAKLLEKEGWITQKKSGREPAQLSLSQNIKSLLCSYTSSLGSSPMIAPFIEDLAEISGESAAFALWQGEGIRFTAKREMAESFHYIPVGTLNRYNFHNGFNITCLAYLAPNTIKSLFAKPQNLSLIDSVDTAEKLFEKIRTQDYLYWEDAAARITTPVFFNHAVLAVAVGISFLKNKFSNDRKKQLITDVKNTAEAISRILQS